MSNLFRSAPSVPRQNVKAIPVNQGQSIRAADEVRARLSRIRAANVRTSALSQPSIGRKQLGAGV